MKDTDKTRALLVARYLATTDVSTRDKILASMGWHSRALAQILQAYTASVRTVCGGLCSIH
jgi:hypothetical protein